MGNRIKLVTDHGGHRFEINPPFDIGPRLCPSILLSDGSRVTIYPLPKRDSEGRVRYEWWVDGPPARKTMKRMQVAGDDLRGPASGEVDIEAIYDAFANFLESWVESLNSGCTDPEHIGLWPMEMREWAEANHDELYLLLTEPEGVIA